MREIEILKKPVFWLVLLLVLLGTAIWQLPDRQLHLVFCDVGQGDAILIYRGTTQILVDGGPSQRVLDCLSNHLPFWDRTVEMVILTHPQDDHFTGLIDVIERYSVKQFVVNSIVNDSAGFWEFHQAILEEEAKIYSPKAGDKIRLGPMQFLVLWPKERLGNEEIWLGNTFLAHECKNFLDPDVPSGLRHKFAQNGCLATSSVLGAATYSGDLNESSIVLKLSFGNFDALLTGDISTKIDGQLDLSDIEVLKVAHHGSKYSTSEEFLKQAKPELAVISVGKNPWGHPTEEVLERLSNQAIKLLRTDQEGEIEVVSDGKSWRKK